MIWKPTKIIVHHSLTEDGQTVSCGAIRRWHVQHLGYDDIGYHALIELAREDYEIFIGRIWTIPGAHTRGQNYDSLGVCFIGNYDEIEPPDEILRLGAKVISLWMDLYSIPLDNVFAHRDFADYKSCPGRLFDMDKLKRFILEERN